MIEKVETATEPRFQEHFVAAMAFPHSRHRFPRLSAAVELPEPPVTEGRPRRRSRKETT